MAATLLGYQWWKQKQEKIATTALHEAKIREPSDDYSDIAFASMLATTCIDIAVTAAAPLPHPVADNAGPSSTISIPSYQSAQESQDLTPEREANTSAEPSAIELPAVVSSSESEVSARKDEVAESAEEVEHTAITDLTHRLTATISRVTSVFKWPAGSEEMKLGNTSADGNVSSSLQTLVPGPAVAVVRVETVSAAEKAAAEVAAAETTENPFKLKPTGKRANQGAPPPREMTLAGASIDELEA